MSGKKPITVFEETITRATALLDMVDAGDTPKNPDDVVRGAVMLSVAAFDRYFTAKFCDVLVPHLKNSKTLSDPLLSRLEEAGFDTKFALELAVSDRPFRKIRTIVQASLSRLTTHRSSVIDELFSSLGLIDLTKHAQAKQKRSNLKSRAQKLVDIRNDIAHGGHVNAHGSPKKISSADIRSRINDLCLLVRSCDAIVDKKFGRKPPVSS